MPPDYDPTYEPEELSEGFTLIPTGTYESSIKAIEVDTTFVSSKGNPGWRYEIDWIIEQYPDVSMKVWMDSSSQFGATQIHNMMLHMDIPYWIPDVNAISQTTQQPRKSFLKFIANKEVNGSFTLKKEVFIGRLCVCTVKHIMQCLNCKWTYDKTAQMILCANNNCDGKEHFNKDTEGIRIYSTIDTTSFMPAVSPQPSHLILHSKQNAIQQPVLEQQNPLPQPSSGQPIATESPSIPPISKTEAQKDGAEDDLPF